MPPHGRPPLIAEAHAERVATPIVEHVEQLVRETPVRALPVVVEVQRFGKDAEIVVDIVARAQIDRSEEHTSELQSLLRTSSAVFCLKTNTHQRTHDYSQPYHQTQITSTHHTQTHHANNN